MLPAEQAAPLKLLEKGVSKEALAGLVLLEFPCEVVGAVLAGRWAAAASPLRPWFLGYRLRLAMAAAVTCLVSLRHSCKRNKLRRLLWTCSLNIDSIFYYALMAYA